jgi:hypothetical protein
MIVYHGSYKEIEKPDVAEFQIAFRSQKVIDEYLHFERSESL